VIGARRSQLILQFLGESLLLSFIALPLAVILYEIIHPIFYSYIGNFSSLGFTQQLSSSIWNYPFLLKYLLLATIFTGILAGLYPALFLSAVQPLRILRGSLQTGRKKKRGSKFMIVFQFSLAVIFIACSGILKHQSGQLLKADLGYNRERVAFIRLVQSFTDWSSFHYQC